MKEWMTSNLYDPYSLGYTRVTMVLAKSNNFFKTIGVNL